MNVFELIIFMVWATALHWLSVFLSLATGLNIYAALVLFLWITILLIYLATHKKPVSRFRNSTSKTKSDIVETILFVTVLNIAVIASEMAVAFSLRHAIRSMPSWGAHLLFACAFVIFLLVQGAIVGRALRPGRPQ